MKITVRELKKVLENALLNEGKMEQALFEYEFEELMDELLESLIADKDDYLFALTTHKNDITGNEDTAMVLIEPTGTVYINEVARDKLKEVWENSYERNIKQLIPDFAKQLYSGEIPINGIKTV
ncbi:MAG: hypothetical protein WCL60_10365 [Methylococcales bacterium]